jgi:hypothetical protein
VFDAIDKNDDHVGASDVFYDWKKKGDGWLTARRIEGFWCSECLTPLAFVRGSLSESGKSSHFKVFKDTPHTEQGCETLKRAVSKAAGSDTAQVKPGILNDGSVRAIRYALPSPLGYAGAAPSGTGGGSAGGGSAGQSTTYAASGGTPNTQETTSLRAVLRTLRNVPTYPSPKHKIQITDRGEVYATDYFCKFEDATPELANPLAGNNEPRLMAFWGRITKAQDQGSLFLASDGMSAMVRPTDKQALLDLLGLKEIRELEGWHIIAEGRLHVAASASKSLYVKVPELNRLALLPPKK